MYNYVDEKLYWLNPSNPLIITKLKISQQWPLLVS